MIWIDRGQAGTQRSLERAGALNDMKYAVGRHRAEKVAVGAATLAVVLARVILLRRRTLAIDMLARRVRVFVGVLMTMFGGGNIVVMVSVVMCKLAGSRRTMMNVYFSRHDGLGGERSNGQHKG